MGSVCYVHIHLSNSCSVGTCGDLVPRRRGVMNGWPSALPTSQERYRAAATFAQSESWCKRVLCMMQKCIAQIIAAWVRQHRLRPNRIVTCLSMCGAIFGCGDSLKRFCCVMISLAPACNRLAPTVLRVPPLFLRGVPCWTAILV